MDSDLTFKPQFVLTVKVIGCRKASVGKLRDKLDIPDPFVRIKCRQSKSRQSFQTKTIMNDPNAKWNETFSFILPMEMHENFKNFNQELNLKVSLFDEDLAIHDLIGKATLDLSSHPLGQNKEMEVDFGKHGKVDLEVLLVIKKQPDFRYSHDITEEEKTIVKSRKENSFKNMKTMFGEDGPEDLIETPTIAICGSGGGYRAMTGLAGALEVLQTTGIIDISTYIMGLSGSAWFLISALADEAFNSQQDLLTHKNKIQRAMRKNLYRYAADLGQIVKFGHYSKNKVRENQPCTFIDFYGYCLGKTYLKSHLKKTLSHLQTYVNSGNVPFPIFTALHVDSNTNSDEFNVLTEMTPYELSLPNFAINIPTTHFGSNYNAGVLLHRCTEQPMHFFTGMTGSALGITFDEFEKLKETDAQFKKALERRKTFGYRGVGTMRGRGVKNRASIQMAGRKYTTKKKSIASNVSFSKKSTKKKKTDEHTQNMIRNMLSSREFLLDRTAKVFNFVHNFQDINYRPLSLKNTDKEKYITIENSTDKLSFVDAAVNCNVPVVSVLRPQRQADVLIVFDFSEYKDDEDIDYGELFKCQQKAKEQGLKFPPIDKDELASDPLNEVHVFKDEDDEECPIVIWFTLSSRKYKKVFADVYSKPLCCKEPTSEADFHVFGEESEYPTLKTKFSPREFKRLSKMMAFNVSSNLKLLKNEIKDSIARKRSSRFITTRL